MWIKSLIITFGAALINAALAHSVWWILPSDWFDFLPLLPANMWFTILGSVLFGILISIKRDFASALLFLTFFVLVSYFSLLLLALQSADQKSFMWIQVTHIFAWILSVVSILVFRWGTKNGSLRKSSY